jgi:hypothetical protein
LILLGVVEMVNRVVASASGSGLHLDSGNIPINRDNEIEFSAPDAQVPVSNDGAAVLQKTGGNRFAKSAESSVAYRAELGSSSSMFTSRNVITLTLLTNRAGRYMSHTHASFNSNSK